MSEFTSSPEQQPLSREEMAARLFELVGENLPWRESGVHENWYAERSIRKVLTNGDAAELKRFPYSGSLDHNFADPVRRLRASIATTDAEFTVWDMNPDETDPAIATDPVVSDPEVFVSRGGAPGLKREILKAKLTTATEKAFNHAVTSGVFINGVEQERRQRMFNRIHQAKVKAGVTRPASEEEIRHVLMLLEPQT